MELNFFFKLLINKIVRLLGIMCMLLRILKEKGIPQVKEGMDR